MPGNSVPGAKRCVRCGRDCSNVPRVKNPAGDYCCRECIDNPRRKHISEGQPPAAEPAPPGINPPAPPHEHGPPADAPIEIEGGMPVPNLDPLPPPATPEPSDDEYGSLVPCNDCGKLIRSGANVCVYFGTSTGAGSGGSAPGRPGGTCSKCGYDLTGLTKSRCPECGERITKRGVKQRLAEASAQSARREYLKPAIVIAVCLPLWLLTVTLAQGRSEIPMWLGALGVRAGIGAIVYIVIGLAWMGFDAPMRLVLLRLLAALTATDLAVACCNAIIPIRWIRWTIPAFVLVATLAELSDIDVEDAAIIGVLMYALGFGTWFWIAIAMGWV